MKSSHVINYLTGYIDQTLEPHERERVKSHLIFCKSCRHILNDLEKNITTLKAIPKINPPVDLAGKILTSAKEEPESKEAPKPTSTTTPPKDQWFLSLKGAAVLATCLLVGVAVWNIPSKKKSGEGKSFLSEVAQVSPDQPESSLKRQQKLDKIEELAPDDSSGLYNKDGKLQSGNEGFDGFDMKRQLKQERRESEVYSMARGAGGGIVSDESLSESDSLPRKRKESKKRALAKAASAPTEKQIYKSNQKKGPFTALYGQFSGISDPVEVVIKTERAWKKLWRKHNQFQDSVPPLPEVDFKENLIVAIFAGNKSSGGFSISIKEPEITTWEGEEARIIRYKLNQPRKGRMSTMAVNQPFSMKVFPKISGETFIMRIP